MHVDHPGSGSSAGPRVCVAMAATIAERTSAGSKTGHGARCTTAASARGGAAVDANERNCAIRASAWVARPRLSSAETTGRPTRESAACFGLGNFHRRLPGRGRPLRFRWHFGRRRRGSLGRRLRRRAFWLRRHFGRWLRRGGLQLLSHAIAPQRCVEASDQIAALDPAAPLPQPFHQSAFPSARGGGMTNTLTSAQGPRARGNCRVFGSAACSMPGGVVYGDAVRQARCRSSMYGRSVTARHFSANAIASSEAATHSRASLAAKLRIPIAPKRFRSSFHRRDADP